MLRLFQTVRLVGASRSISMASRWMAPTMLKMPALSPTMTDGSIVSWGKKEGEEITAGDVLCEVQTDKAVVALEAEDDGVLAKIFVPENTPNIMIGQVIAVLAAPDENWQEIAASAVAPEAAPATTETAAEPVAAAAAPPQPSAAAPPAAPATPGGSPTKRPDLIGPAVRVLLQKHGLDAMSIPATGPHGILQKGDVLAYIASPTPAAAAPKAAAAKPAAPPPPVAGAGYIDLPLSDYQRALSEQIANAKRSIPHTYVKAKVCTDKLDKLRSGFADAKKAKLTLGDFVLKACALALRMVPELNACGSADASAVHQASSVDICFTVCTPEGTVHPVVRNVDHLPLSQLSQTTASLSEKALLGMLEPEHQQGGSFTLCNMSSSGIRECIPIINAPHVATLTIGTPQSRASQINTENPKSVDFSSIASLVLSIDTRYTDEVAAGRFLNHLSQILTDHPELLTADDPALQSSNNNADEFTTMMLSQTLGLGQPSVV